MKTLISATAALALLAAPAFAQSMKDARGKADDAVKDANDASGRVVALTGALNGQINLGDVTSELTVVTEKTSDAAATAAAIGNSASLSVASATGVVGSAVGQANKGDVAAVADVAVREAGKATSVTAAAIGNSISIVNGVAQ